MTYQTQGAPSQQQYVTGSPSSSGIISSLVCPYPYQQNTMSWENLSEFGALLRAFVCNAMSLFQLWLSLDRGENMNSSH